MVANGDCINQDMKAPHRANEYNQQQFSESMQQERVDGAYTNNAMLNGSAYNSPNLAGNRGHRMLSDRSPGDGSLSNPDVVPSEQFPSINTINKASNQDGGDHGRKHSNQGKPFEYNQSYFVRLFS